ncbi:MAG: DNA repair protein RecO [Clostridia bacterium]|nr:DNA repair protein RecO [Clostridia bacterium]
MYESCTGIVLRHRHYGETDTQLTLLTAELGRVYVLAKGIRSIKNANYGACQLYTYSHFQLSKRGDGYVLSSAELIESFFGVHTQLEVSAAADCMNETALLVSLEGSAEPELLRLLLNCLYFLKQGYGAQRIKTVFFLKLAVLAGYEPDVTACACGGKQTRFFLYDGELGCEQCTAGREYLALTPSVLQALRFVLEAPLRRTVDFLLGEENSRLLEELSEEYLCAQLGEKPKTLDFYRRLASLPT